MTLCEPQLRRGPIWIWTLAFEKGPRGLPSLIHLPPPLLLSSSPILKA